MKPDQHKVLLHFFDKDLERQFVHAQEIHIRYRLRLGIMMSIVFFSLGIPLIYITVPDMFYHLTLSMVLVLFPYYIFLFYSTFKDRFLGYYHMFAATSNVLAGLLIIYVCQFFPNGENYMLMILIFIVFFGLYMYRLGLILGISVSLLYILSFQIYITFYVDLDPAHYIMLTFLAWLTEAFSIIAGHISEQNNRTLFIQQKTIQKQNVIIRAEKKKSENLLLNILPGHIADRLKKEEEIIADTHQNISVMFADIVGFTNLSEQVSAEKLVMMLNKVFSHFDTLTEEFKLEKVKTIGDAYMVAGGLQPNDESHLERIVELSIAFLKRISEHEELKMYKLEIRIGIHAGPVVAGVIGLNKFTYDLWGDTVNIASRMESNSEAGRINVTETVKRSLENQFSFEKRKPIDIKGKGKMQTYFLIGDE